jgi:TorA maturation chaperone TorD
MPKHSTRISEGLALCADLLDYPGAHYTEHLQQLQLLFGDAQCNFSSFSMEKIEGEYLRLFSIEATANRTVPIASWWLDGSTHGTSMRKIEAFYKECGYEIDPSLHKVPDHLVMMLRFLSLLSEDGSYAEAKAFSRFLIWLNDFEKSLESTSVLCSFPLAVKYAIIILETLNRDH